MDKEELFKEYARTYKDYLWGKCSFDDAYKIIEKINSAALEEASDESDIGVIIRANNIRIKEIEKEVKAEYDEMAGPIVAELLDFLQFRGMVRSVQYKKRAEELKKKLQECDGNFIIRERALAEFFATKIGSRYDDFKKMKLMLRLGALDTKNL